VRRCSMLSGVLAITAIVLVFGFVAFAFWALNSRWLAERGWIYNKHNRRPGRPRSLGLLETIYQPSIEHVIEEQSSEAARGDQDDSGGKPDPGEVPPPG
jgi:hypothetical protein